MRCGGAHQFLFARQGQSAPHLPGQSHGVKLGHGSRMSCFMRAVATWNESESRIADRCFTALLESSFPDSACIAVVKPTRPGLACQQQAACGSRTSVCSLAWE